MKTYINMQKASSAYLVGLGLLLGLSLLLQNVPHPKLASYIGVDIARWLAAVGWAFAGLGGVAALICHRARVDKPWQVPQSQVSIFYIVFFLGAMVGVLASN